MPRQRRDWQKYVDAIASRMRLSHWQIIVKDEPPGSEAAMAAMTPWNGRYVASLWLSDQFLTNNPTDQRYTIVHELTHCYQAQANALIRDDLSAATEKAWVMAHEYGVDQTATVIAQFMPLPDAILDLEPAILPFSQARQH